MRFVERYCVVPEGDLVGKPLRLAGFQEDFYRAVYDNEVATERAYLSIARKNAKTGTIATIALVHLVGPEAVQNSRISSGARSRKQAAEVYNYAAKMVLLSPDLRKIVRPIPSTKKLIGLLMNTEYEALAAEGATAHGGSPILAILDEVGQVRGPKDDFVDAIITSQGAYSNALLIAISTQAPTDGDLFSIWLDGAEISQDPAVVSHLYRAPDGCSLDDETALKAANPGLDIFRSRKELMGQVRRAQEMPSFANTFRVLGLNQRVNPFSPLISRDAWMACAAEGPLLRDGERIYLALDLASVNDLAALVAVSEEDGDRVAAWLFKPEEVLRDHGQRDRVDYEAWAEAGHLIATPGPTIDRGTVASVIVDLCERFEVIALAYDRWRIDELLAEFGRRSFPAFKGDDGDGLRLVDWGQGFVSMAPAIDAFERAVLERRLVHPSNPVLTWTVANAIVKQDEAGNRKLDKKAARFRIDGAVALAMAEGLKARERPAEPGGTDLGEFLQQAASWSWT